MNDTERTWLESMAEAERGVPIAAGSAREADERTESATELRFPYLLWCVVFLTFGLILLPLQALGKAVLPSEW